jgi:hypothetical protein
VSGSRPVLRVIGALRNKFAHRLGTTLTQDDADAVFAAFRPEVQEMSIRVYSEMKAKRGRDLGPLPELSAKDRLVLYLTVVWAAMTSRSSGARASGNVRRG